MTVHIQTVHFKERIFKCELCEHKFLQKSNLSTHIKNVHQKEKKEMTFCAECNKSMQKSYVTSHMKKFHSKQQYQYSCKSCSFQKIHQLNLEGHVRNFHLKEHK